MMPIFPDVLKKNSDQWYFSDDEPWKPVAKPGASEEVKKEIEEFVSLLEKTE